MSENKVVGGKKNSLDLLKLILAVIIVLRHCGQVFYNADTVYVKVITNSISPIGVPIFFIISGYLFFIKKRTGLDLKKYIIRVLKLYGIWSLIYLPLIFIEMTKRGELNLMGFIHLIQKVVFDGTYYHLWYLPSLVVAIALVYLLSKKLNNKNLIVLGVLLYILGTLYDTYELFSVMIYNKIFITTRNGIFFGIIFIVAGKCIAEENIERINEKILLGIGGIVLILESYYLNWVQGINVVNMSFASLIVAPMIVILFLKYTDSFKNINGKLLRNISTFVYCAHPWCITIISFVGRKLALISSLEILIIVFGCLVMGYVISKMADKITGLKILF